VSGLRLVPLRCAKCSGALTASGAAAVLLCGACGAGFEVHEDGTLAPIAVSFARYAPASEQFHPFWTFEARLRLRARESNRARSDGLASRFQERGSLRFYCAAFASDIENKGKWSLHLTSEQPALQPISPQKDVAPIAFSQAEARLLASDLFVTSELQLPDMVRVLDFDLELKDPRLVVIAL
jgi:hypothetical protein